MKKKERVTLYISDQHIPYNDEFADELVFAVAEELKPDELIIGGDCVDFWQISKFNNNPLNRARGEIRTVQDDADEVHDYLRQWRKALKRGAKLVYMEGNHEDRLRSWVDRHYEVAGVRELKPEEFFGIAKAGVDKYVPYKPKSWTRFTPADEDHWIIPNTLLAIHGYRYSINAGYVSNHMLRDYGCSGISGHNHKIGMSMRQLKREQVAWWESGCLCKVFPDYKKHANWQQGFTLIYSNPNDPNDYDVETVRILPNYRCRANGIKFSRKGPM